MVYICWGQKSSGMATKGDRYMQLKKNEVRTVTIEGVNSQGAGVARIDGRAVFVAGALPGERCEIKLLKVSKTAVYAKVLRIIEPSEHRIEPECSYFPKCGGCDFLHVDYDKELDIKKDRVNDALRRIGGLNISVTEIIGAPSRQRYRNKAIFAVSKENGRTVTGFYRPRSHKVIPVESCLIQSREADEAAIAIREWMDRYSVSFYNEADEMGLIRNIFVRTAFSTGMTMVCIISNGDIPRKSELVDLIRERLPSVVSIILNINKSRGNVVLSGSFTTLWGSDYVEDILHGMRFRLSPLSFYQINSHQVEKLYSKALEYAGLTGKEKVLDLYCGTGTIGLCAAPKAEKVIGVEMVEAAVSDAKVNAELNSIKNAEFICADAGEAAKILARRGFRPDVVFLDPPRKGLAAEVIGIVSEMSPRRIVYVSCDPATLARDLKLFDERGYKAIEATAVDMFPGTQHVECIALLQREIS
jgi:23S rRNA (uracil1939-C5)-methyltransferase